MSEQIDDDNDISDEEVACTMYEQQFGEPPPYPEYAMKWWSQAIEDNDLAGYK